MYFIALLRLSFNTSPAKFYLAMPSHTAASTLIKLWTENSAPWAFPRWQDITGVHHGLFPLDDTQLPSGLSRSDVVSIQSYFKQYSNIATEDNKIKFARSRRGAAVPGRDIWQRYVQKSIKSWKIHDIIIEGLRQSNVHPIDLLLASNDKQWPLANHYIPLAIDSIGISLFGTEALDEMDRIPMTFRTALQSLIQCTWNTLRQQITAAMNKLSENQEKAIKSLESMSTSVHCS